MTAPLVDAAKLSETHSTHPIKVDLKYAIEDNFIGKPLPGYDPAAKHRCLLMPKAAQALCQVQSELNKSGLGLLVFDAYRPLRTVRYFTEWFTEPPTETELKRKALHYPHLTKADLPKLGYVAADVSRHCFGFAIDLTLIHLNDQTELPMGAIFDYFDRLSHTDITAEEIGEEALNNRNTLSKAMQNFGFLPYSEEFWHFDYHEHESKVPLDLPITCEQKKHD